VDEAPQKLDNLLIFDTKEQQVDFEIGLALIGEQGREQLSCYLQTRRDRKPKKQRVRRAG
jgi:hypothetical protein